MPTTSVALIGRVLVCAGILVAFQATAVENGIGVWSTNFWSGCGDQLTIMGSDRFTAADKACFENNNPAHFGCVAPPPTQYYGAPHIMGCLRDLNQPGASQTKVYQFGCTQGTSPDPWPVLTCPVPTYPAVVIAANVGYFPSAGSTKLRLKDNGKPNRCNAASGSSDIYQGNPIHIGTGNKYEQVVIYSGLGSDQLIFTIHYNSRYPEARTDGFGTAWKHAYQRKVVFDLDSDPNLAIASRADGKVLGFLKSGAAWLADSDIADVLQETVNGSGVRTGWTYQNANDDSVESYDAMGNLLSIADRSGLTTTLQYSDGTTPVGIAPRPGMLIQITDAFGKALQLQYDTLSRVQTMTDPAAGIYQFSYTADHDLASVTFPDSKVRSFIYNEAANVSLHPSMPSTMKIGHLLTGITDENNQRFATFSYQAFFDAFAVGVVATHSEHAGGVNAVTLTYSQDPSTLQPGVTYSTNMVDALGASRTYSFKSILGQIQTTQVSQPCASGCGASAAATTHDTNGNVATMTDWNGNQTSFSYDLARNLETSRTEALGTALSRTVTTQWHTIFRLPAGIAEPLRVTAYTYDSNGSQCGARGALCSKSAQATTDANGFQGFGATTSGAPRAWNYSYNANGKLLTANGPRTDVVDITTYIYYANNASCPTSDGGNAAGCRGQVSAITNALGYSTQITAYNAHGQPLRIQDPNGQVTMLSYDARLRLTSRVAGGEVTSYQYDGVGQLTKATLPDGSFLSYAYDDAHRLTAIQDNLGNRIAYTLDLMGNRTQEQIFDPTNALAQTRSRVYNSLSRLAQEIGAQGQTTAYGYDSQGNVTTVDGPLTGTVDVTTNTYDSLNRLIRVTNPLSGQVNYGLNARDQIVSVSDPRNLVTTYSVDGLGNLNTQVSPDTGTTGSTYDAAGNLLTRTDAKGQVTTYAYDALNRVTSITYQGGVIHAYQYDQGANGVGRLTSITEPNSSTQYVYDIKGRLTSETRVINAISYVTSYAYDGSGRLTSMTYPSGRQIAYTIDAMGRVSQIVTTKNGTPQTVLSLADYRPFGPMRAFQFGNGQVYTRGFDQDGRMYGYMQGSQAIVLGFDAASRITSAGNYGQPPSNTYAYDNLDRLTQAVLPSSTFAYSYDAVGNRLTKTIGVATETDAYGGSSNRLATITPATGPVRTVVSDANGSITNDAVRQFTYDTRGRMTQSVWSRTTTNYKVNALGQRTRKTNFTGDTVYHYDKDGRLIAESSAAGVLQIEYVYLGDIPVGVFKGGNPPASILYYIHTDHLNTPRLIANQNQQVVWRMDQTEPFGSDAANSNPSGLGTFEFNLRFPGQYFDKETNLHYNYNRDYDPAMGRYPQSDPIGLRGGINTYSYVGGNPISRIDPSGLASLVVERSDQLMYVYDNAGNLITAIPVNNNTTNPAGDPNVVGSNSPAPSGAFPVQPPVSTGSSVEYGPYFFPIGAVGPGGSRLDIARQRGIGIHGGRRGPNSRTQGCLRVDNDDIRWLRDLNLRDPITDITIR